MINNLDYYHRYNCRFCKSRQLNVMLDLGSMPLAGNYLTKEEIGKEKSYPLCVYICERCFLVQILDVVNPKVLFKDYRYLSSVSLSKHFEEYAQDVFNNFAKLNSFVVEIGSNDGVLLKPLKKYGLRVLGVDPAKNIAEIALKQNIDTIIDYFTDQLSTKIIKSYGKADIILANNVLAHIDDMDDVFRGINNLMKKNAVLIFETHHFLQLFRQIQYDFFYNEHLSYYTVRTLREYLNSFGLEIFNIKPIKIHSGTIRVFVKKRINKNININSTVDKIVALEERNNLFNIDKIKYFSNKVEKHSKSLRNTLLNIKNKGYRIAAYGASGRGNTLLNFCKINKDIIDYVVDESPERINRFTPGTHIPIVEPTVFRQDNINYSLLLAWNYKELILKKEKDFLMKGGKFIMPFPKIDTIPA